jgi:hypothetical protein
VTCWLLRQGIYLHVPVLPFKNVFVRIALIENDTIVGTSDIGRSRSGHRKRNSFLNTSIAQGQAGRWNLFIS